MTRTISLVLLLSLFTGCATQPAMTQTELYFGLARKDGPNVTEAQWQQFVDEEVTPRFPDGFTVLIAQGQWRGPDGQIVREPSRVIMVVGEPSAEMSRKLDELRQIYKQRFNQDAVMRIDDSAKVQF